MKSVHCLFDPGEMESLSHAEIVARLKAQGFKLDGENCPIKITQHQVTELHDGSVMWQQDQDVEVT